ncbi:MAG: lactonase family protein [Sphingobacteriaceae bacterium]|nr:lactonase family protein [Sphingobacteriaceae bacterium]
MKLFKFTSCFFFLLCVVFESEAQKLNLLIGTYTKPGKSEGIYVYEFDLQTGKAAYKNKAAGLNNPSYLAVNKKEDVVYSVSEAGPGKGSVSAFRFDKKTGGLSLLNSKPSGGDGPCYVAVDKKSKHVFVANYTGGSFTAICLSPDGSLGNSISTHKFTSNGVGKGQQEKPHAHSTVLSPDEKRLYVSDLGNDEIVGFKYSSLVGDPLKPAQLIKLPAGNGPRHFEFHPNKKFGYAVQELTCEVVAYRYKNKKLSFLQSISSLPAGYKGRKWAADIHVSPDGKFLYSSNRDDANEIAIFAIQKDGKLTLTGRQSSLGKAPRNFVIDPTGNYLLAANQNSDNVVIFKRDRNTGMLTDTGERIDVGAPVCLKFASTE